ncbi:MAG: S8 family serine peptidase [Candidatus Omnitrophica bacterium]|nr:S8 family serine peptidase [Candidatus Omnitrophota bacterium]
MLAALVLAFPSIALAIVKEQVPDYSGSSVPEVRGSRPSAFSFAYPKQPPSPTYAPGRLIVKYKDSVTKCVHCLLRQRQSLQSVLSDGSTSLDTLHKRYGVQAAWPLFRQEGQVQASSTTILSLSQLQSTEQQALNAVKTKFGARTKRIPPREIPPALHHVYLLQVMHPYLEQAADAFRQDPHVAYAQPDYAVQIQWSPNDPYYASSNSWGQGYRDLWGLQKLNVAQAWDSTKGVGITVAIIDTGADLNHGDLSANRWTNAKEIAGNALDDDGNGFIDDVQGWDFANGDNDPTDDHGHGTHVTGTIAAVGNNGKGIIGVAPLAKVMAIKGLDGGGNGYASNLTEALQYAAFNGADVLNNSWGGYGDMPAVADAVRLAHSLGCVVVAAAGNDDAPVEDLSPAKLPEVIAVGASDHLDARASFSNWGWKLDLLAPGGDSTNSTDANQTYANILSLRAGSTSMYGGSRHVVGTYYYRARGTSMATPHVAGVAALLLAYRPQLTNEDVRTVLRLSADDIGLQGREPMSGFGRVNALRAIQTSLIPFLFIQSYQLKDDAGSGGNGDGFFSPGETLALTVTITNGGLGLSAGGNATLIGNAAQVTVLSTSVSLGSLSRGATQAVTFRLKINATAATYQPISSLQVRLTGPGMPDRLENLPDIGEVIPGTTPPPVQTGWPVRLLSNGLIPSELLVANLDGAGPNEVAIIAALNELAQAWVLGHDGRLWPGWPQSSFTSWSGFHPLAADLDENGDLELFLHPKYRFDHDGKMTQWASSPSGCPEDPQVTGIADLNKDGVVEVVGLLTHCSSGNLFVWDRQGRLLPNMPIQAPVVATDPNGKQIRDFLFPPALGDLDGDGDLELVTIGTHAFLENGLLNHRSHLYAWHHTGAMVLGWPKDLGRAFPGWPGTAGTPVLGDVDGDGKDEIVTVNVLPAGGGLDIWRGDGTPKPGWPVFFPFPSSAEMISVASWSPAVGDLDGDGTLEVVVVETQWLGGKETVWIHAYHGASYGSPVAGWPKKLPGYTVPLSFSFDEAYYREMVRQPILADVTGDYRPEILLNLIRRLPASDRYVPAIFGWQGDGTSLSGFPFHVVTQGRPNDIQNLYLGDVDGDGDQELGLIHLETDPNLTFATIVVSLWDLPNRAPPDANQWSMYKHDVRRTNRHAGFVDLDVTGLSGPTAGIIGKTASLTTTVRNRKLGTSGAFKVGLYLSTDTSITRSDTRVGMAMVTSLAGSTSKTLTTTVTVPSHLLTGAYYWGAIVDSADAVMETSETNNVLVGNRTKWTKLDLTVDAVSGPKGSGISPDVPLIPGSNTSVTATTRNSGQEASWACAVGLYLSTDATITTSDLRVGSYTQAAGLAVGATKTTTAGVTIPTYISPGTYYWGAIVDYNNALFEISETNNTKAGNAVKIQAAGGSPPIDM